MTFLFISAMNASRRRGKSASPARARFPVQVHVALVGKRRYKGNDESGNGIDSGRAEPVNSADGSNTPVRAQAVLVDPGSMRVLWANESALQAFLDRGGDSAPGASIDQVVPMAEALGVPEALRVVADTGVARHLRADVVSTARGSMGLAVSVYRLPDGNLLVLTENAWHTGRDAEGGSAPRRPRGRAR